MADPLGVAAKAVLFVGTRRLEEFSYDDIERFGYAALSALRAMTPPPVEVALTLQGVGFGLDEVACFEAELAGVSEALERGDAPPSVQSITFLEIDPRRAGRMRERLSAMFGSPSTPGAEDRPPQRWRVDANERATSRTTHLERPRDHAFVAMPFDEEFTDVFHYGIANAVRANGLLCERMDEQAFTGDILHRLRQQIQQARVVIADVTGANANVFLEVGFAWGKDVPTVLVCNTASKLVFDVQGQRCIFYRSIRDLEGKLEEELRRILPTI